MNEVFRTTVILDVLQELVFFSTANHISTKIDEVRCISRTVVYVRTNCFRNLVDRLIPIPVVLFMVQRTSNRGDDHAIDTFGRIRGRMIHGEIPLTFWTTDELRRPSEEAALLSGVAHLPAADVQKVADFR